MKRIWRAMAAAPVTPATFAIAFVWALTVGFVIAMSIPKWLVGGF